MQISYNISATLVEQARKHPYQQAVIEPLGHNSSGQPIYSHLSYQQLNRLSDLMASALMHYGIKDHCRTALMVPPSLNFFVLTFALFKAGAVPVLIDPGLGIKRIKRCLEEAEVEAFIGIPKAQLARLLFSWGKKSLKHVITVGRISMGGKRLSALMKEQENKPLLPQRLSLPDDPAAILFTSGSTGAPKGALYTHRNFHAQIDALRQSYQIQPGERDLCTFPLFALFAPALGMTAVIPQMNFTRPGQVNPERIFEPIEHFGISNLFGSPALIRRVGMAACQQKRIFPSLQRVVSAGAPVPAEAIASFRQCLSKEAKFFTPYGATEALPVCSIESQEILADTSYKTDAGHGICLGKPLGDSEVRIIKISDEPITEWHDNLLLPAGEIGEIIVSGPQVTRSYYNRQEATRAGKIRKGQAFYHRMGDLGYFDSKGRLWFCGRKSHRVVCGEQTLYTIPCEGVFNTHPEVFRTALVGVGKAPKQTPVICIEAKQAKLSAADKKRLIQQLRELGKKFKHTSSIELFLLHPAFPVDIRHNSKIFREKLAKWAEGVLR